MRSCGATSRPSGSAVAPRRKPPSPHCTHHLRAPEEAHQERGHANARQLPWSRGAWSANSRLAGRPRSVSRSQGMLPNRGGFRRERSSCIEQLPYAQRLGRQCGLGVTGRVEQLPCFTPTRGNCRASRLRRATAVRFASGERDTRRVLVFCQVEQLPYASRLVQEIPGGPWGYALRAGTGVVVSAARCRGSLGCSDCRSHWVSVSGVRVAIGGAQGCGSGATFIRPV